MRERSLLARELPPIGTIKTAWAATEHGPLLTDTPVYGIRRLDEWDPRTNQVLHDAVGGPAWVNVSARDIDFHDHGDKGLGVMATQEGPKGFAAIVPFFDKTGQRQPGFTVLLAPEDDSPANPSSAKFWYAGKVDAFHAMRSLVGAPEPRLLEADAWEFRGESRRTLNNQYDLLMRLHAGEPVHPLELLAAMGEINTLLFTPRVGDDADRD